MSLGPTGNKKNSCSACRLQLFFYYGVFHFVVVDLYNKIVKGLAKTIYKQ